jgi:hypothetical protein
LQGKPWVELVGSLHSSVFSHCRHLNWFLRNTFRLLIKEWEQISSFLHFARSFGFSLSQQPRLVWPSSRNKLLLSMYFCLNLNHTSYSNITAACWVTFIGYYLWFLFTVCIFGRITLQTSFSIITFIMFARVATWFWAIWFVMTSLLYWDIFFKEKLLIQHIYSSLIKDQPKLNWRTLVKRSNNFSV